MVTGYGKFLRVLRIDEGENLGTMAERLGISSAYLSSIENGRREIPHDLTKKIIKEYDLGKKEIKKLEKVQMQQVKDVKVTFSKNMSMSRKETALIFARTFRDIDEKKLNEIKKLLNRVEED